MIIVSQPLQNIYVTLIYQIPCQKIIFKQQQQQEE